MANPAPTLTIYTDGSCLKNPGPGGWGALLISNHNGKLVEKEISGSENNTTNNRMELLAVIRALLILKKPCNLEIISDSQYVIKGMSEWMKGWIKSGKLYSADFKNNDLWQLLNQASSTHKIKWTWVRGHSGHPENERADVLATTAAHALKASLKP